MEVVHGRGEEQPAECGQHGIADPAMRPRHRLRQDLAAANRQPTADHQVRTGTQAFEEPGQLAEVVGAVSVTHQHVAAARRGDAAGEGVAIATHGDLDHPGACVQRQGLRAIAAAIVRDQQLTTDAGAGQCRARLGDTGDDGLGLVEAGHENGKLKLVDLEPHRLDRTLIHVFPRSPNRI